jgi:DNA-binding MarR family transcriptional regulator
MLEKLVAKLLRYDRQALTLDKNRQKVTLLELWLIRELEHEDLSIQALADRFDLNRALVARSLEQLIRQGLIEKQRDFEDNRIQKISLTDQGKSMMAYWKVHEEDYLDFVISDLTVNEQKAVLKFLSRLNQLTVGKYDVQEE